MANVSMLENKVVDLEGQLKDLHERHNIALDALEGVTRGTHTSRLGGTVRNCCPSQTCCPHRPSCVPLMVLHEAGRCLDEERV